MKTEKKDHEVENVKNWYLAIADMATRMKQCREDDNQDDFEAIGEEIREGVLSVEVRSDWHTLDQAPEAGSGEYKILLTWGGPALRIIGDYESGAPTTARLEYQDWGTPWTEYRGPITEEGKADIYIDEDILLDFVGVFYFGE